MHKHLLTYNALYFSIKCMHYFCTSFIRAGCRTLYVIHWSSDREGHNNDKRDLVIWLVQFIYSAVGFALCYNYVVMNYCIRFAVLPCVRLCLNSCYLFLLFFLISLLFFFMFVLLSCAYLYEIKAFNIITFIGCRSASNPTGTTKCLHTVVKQMAVTNS